MRGLRWTLAVMAGIMLLPSIVGAQQPEHDGGPPWRTSWFPFVTGPSNDGPLVTLRLRRWQPAPYEARTTFTGAFDAGVGITPSGSRYARLEFEAPLLWSPWRFSANAMASREARFGYFGLGNATTSDDVLVTDAQPFLYRVRRTRYRSHAEVSRYLTPRVVVALAGDVESARFTSLPGPSVFKTDFGPAPLEENDASARLAVVYDTRDVEYNTRRGVLLEAGAQAGTGGGNYTRLYTVLRGYLPVREGTTVAARIAGSGMGGDPTLNARLMIPAWNRGIPVLGGEFSHRSLDAGRLIGRDVLLGNLEIRQDILNFGDYGAISALAFADAGRVFENEGFALTTHGMKVGGGGGIAVRVLRSSIFTFNFAGGPDGFNFSVGNGWMF